MKRIIAVLAVLLCLNFNLKNFSQATELTASINKYPDYAYEYLGNDKFEKFNRKIFTFNSRLNKYAIRPVHTVWASVMPKYGMDRIQSAATNIEFPIRLISCLVQKDLKSSKKETVRFLTNTTLGLGGLYDPAKRYFKMDPVQEDMEQALTKCKVKQGPYLVIPVLTSTTPRALVGKILDTGLNPSSYVGTPVLAIVKAGLFINRTSYMQPLAKMLESTYADPYEVARKLYGIENHIKNSNFDRKEVLESAAKLYQAVPDEADNVINVKNEALKGSAQADNIILKDEVLEADLKIEGYNPQDPVTDAMRTALFDLPGINDSIWTELSVWNRCFSKQVKTASVNIDKSRENYKYRYIMQKDKNAPVAIVYPSIGEGVTSYHSVVLAKFFYDAGYSVIMQGSHFQWEFVKSMPKDYKPGLPSRDADYLQLVTSKILASLQAKYNCNFSEKVVIGTSFGALETLFLADKEYKNNTMNITKYIAVNPPIELIYAMKQMDKYGEDWSKNPSNLKDRVAVTAAKVIQTAQLKDVPDAKIETLPFSQEEAKLITGFIMHQKLSDLVYSVEGNSQPTKTDFYKSVNNMSYQDYAKKYLVYDNSDSVDNLYYETSLHSISDYLKNNNNYKIYHTLDDYLVNAKQLKQLKQYSGEKAVYISNGSHLGFLYRPEFISELKKEVALRKEFKVAVK